MDFDMVNYKNQTILNIERSPKFNNFVSFSLLLVGSLGQNGTISIVNTQIYSQSCKDELFYGHFQKYHLLTRLNIFGTIFT